MKKNIVIIHYNTPYLTECLVRSINFFVKNAIIYIFDNSDKSPFTAKFENVKILDNTKGQIINFDEWIKKYPDREKTSAKRNNFGSAKHAYSVQKCIEILNENFILLDSDILLKKDISDMYSENNIFVGITEFWKARTGVAKHPKERAVPYICFINVQKCKEHEIKYFDEKRIYGLSLNGDNYDTGASFLEDIKQKKLKWKRISILPLIVHYKAGSWVEDAKKHDGYKPISIEDWLERNKKYWNFANEPKKCKKVVYTCITGDYDKIIEPKVVSDEFDYVCFTDNAELFSNVWEIRPLPIETNSLTQVKKQRFVKTHPHLLFKDYDISIWVDGNVEIVGNLDEFIKANDKNDCSIFVPTHPSRKCIYAEEKAVISLKKDTKKNTEPQINRYLSEKYPKNNGLLQSNILLRKHNDEKCIKFMNEWWEEIKNGSHRDQLSFNYVAWKNPDIKITYMDKKISESKWFNWHKVHRRVKKYTPINKPRKTVEQLRADFENIMKKRKKITTNEMTFYGV